MTPVFYDFIRELVQPNAGAISNDLTFRPFLDQNLICFLLNFGSLSLDLASHTREVFYVSNPHEHSQQMI